MSIISNPLFDSLKYYILVMLILITIKPEFMYDSKNRKYKKFGLKKNKTIFTLPFLSIIIAILIYIIVLLIYKLNNNKENKENINYIHVPYFYNNMIPNFNQNIIK
jgi:uncharacterized membrane protein